MINQIRMKKAPSLKLGAFCLFLSLIYTLLISWKLFPYLEQYSLLGIKPYEYLKGKWISTISIAFIPAIGWLFSGYISVKNLAKQNSMNILLQTRTSSEYMSHARVAQKYFGNKEPNSTSDDDEKSIIYILNFLEFVSIGIISGELDESIFKQAWKNTFNLTVKNHKDIILSYQDNIPTIWSNLVWLNNRWQNKRTLYLPENKILRDLYIVFLIIVTCISFCFLSVLLLASILYIVH